MKNKLLIIGAYGYTGKLIAREAINYGIQPILAGRNEMELKALATELNLTYRVIALSESDQSWHDHLQDVHTVLHCAGPFILTYKNVLDQCLKNKVHYLDGRNFGLGGKGRFVCDPIREKTKNRIGMAVAWGRFGGVVSPD